MCAPRMLPSVQVQKGGVKAEALGAGCPLLDQCTGDSGPNVGAGIVPAPAREVHTSRFIFFPGGRGVGGRSGEVDDEVWAGHLEKTSGQNQNIQRGNTTKNMKQREVQFRDS